MKGFLTMLALPALMCQAIAAPTPDVSDVADADAIVALSSAADASPVEIFTALLAAVQAYDAKINETSASVDDMSNPKQRVDAQANVVGMLDNVGDLLAEAIVSTQKKLKGVGEDSQTEAELVSLSYAQVDEITGTLHEALSVLPKPALKPIVKHVVRSLLGLQKPLYRQVDGMLATVLIKLDAGLKGYGLRPLLISIVNILDLTSALTEPA